MTVLLHDTALSPIGEIDIVAKDNILLALEFRDARNRADFDLKQRFAQWTFEEAPDVLHMRTRLARYFARDFSAFDGVHFDGGGTPFQRQVWGYLCSIPVGTTTSYGAMAKALGNPQAMRAVGMANGRNPLAIIVPCHRVIGADGTLTGYGGGIARKRWLLEHEGVVVAAERQGQLFG
jgi:methylated-DNA-[protein]-cysteine S-methyltransferase